MSDEHNEQLMPDLSKPQTPKDYARLYFTGFAMGAADIVPGVSGGTMAFIMGIYESLLNAIKSFNLDAIKLALGFKIKEFAEHTSLRFLIALGLGLLTAIFALSSLLEGWLATQPTFVFAFFGGLVLASVLTIGVKIKWSMNAIIALLVGGVAAFIIVGLPTIGEQLGHSYPVLFVCGAIAICAMILPGISGSFILLILGQYDYILGAVKSLDILTLISVALGCLVGILGFSRILSWLLKHYENTTIALLVGFMVGSIRLIVHRATNLVDEATLVASPIELGTQDIVIALLFALVGFLLVNFIDHLQSRENPLFSLVMPKSKASQPIS